MEKFVPTPSNVAPSGYGWPGQICMHTPTETATDLDSLSYSDCKHTPAQTRCFLLNPTIPVPPQQAPL
jgi:hypothetical protein